MVPTVIISFPVLLIEVPFPPIELGLRLGFLFLANVPRDEFFDHLDRHTHADYAVAVCGIAQ